MVFAIACEPDKIGTMMEGLDYAAARSNRQQLQADIAKLKATRQGIILGNNHLRATNKRIGERFKLYGHEHLEGARPGVRDRRRVSAPAATTRWPPSTATTSSTPWTPIRPATTARSIPGPSGT